MVSRGQLERPEIATRISFGVCFTFVRSHSSVYSLLSLNITREVFSYIGNDSIFVVAPRANQLKVFNLAKKTVSIIATKTLINTECAGFVLFTTDEILVMGGSANQGRSAVCVNIWSGVVTTEASMSQDRSWPGVLVFRECVGVWRQPKSQFRLSGEVSPYPQDLEQCTLHAHSQSVLYSLPLQGTHLPG